jgi:transposase-like protein
MKRTESEKASLVSEYLASQTSYRQFGEILGIDFRTLHSWVKKSAKFPDTSHILDESLSEPDLPRDVKQLQLELRKAQLHNKLLNTMIDIAEKQLNIDIRKKSGTKQ